MKPIDMDGVDQLLKDAKYVVATASVFKHERTYARDVAIMGFSSKKAYETAFKDWNNGLNTFYYGLHVENGKLYDDDGRILIPDWVFNRTTKQRHRSIKEAMA